MTIFIPFPEKDPLPSISLAKNTTVDFQLQSRQI